MTLPSLLIFGCDLMDAVLMTIGIRPIQRCSTAPSC